MSLNIEGLNKKVSEILTLIQNILSYDSQIIFTDTFDRIFQQLKSFESIVNEINSVESNYWIVYNTLLSIFPILEKLVFCGYSDQILEYLLQIHYTVSSSLIFRTTRFIPFRMQIFSLVCFAMSNTQKRSDKDAENFINTFKSELLQLKQLEETNINGLSVEIKTCGGDVITLEDLFKLCNKTIAMMSVHFSSTEEIEFEKAGQQKPKHRQKKAVKEEVQVQVQPLPSQEVVEMIINAFDSPISKSDYLTKYAQIAQAWTNPECKLDAALLHRLLFSFIRSGSFKETEGLLTSQPDDPIVKLASYIAEKNWMDASDLLASLPKEMIETDYQFFNEIALKIWHEFSSGHIKDPLVLTGVLHVLVLLPSPCPMHIALVALHLCLHLESLNRYEECVVASRQALEVINNFRDIFATRKIEKIIPPTQDIPTKPIDKSFRLFEHWLECLHTDLLIAWITSQLKDGLIKHTEVAKKKYEEYIEEKKQECEKTKKLYGLLNQQQKDYYNQEISRPFKPPSHSEVVENKLLEQFKNNYAIKALIYIQMAFFRPNKAAHLLEQARQCLIELESITNQTTSPIVYVNRFEAVLSASDLVPLVNTVCLYGKEIVGSSGLTTSNVHISGCGIKQDKSEPFIVTNLKPNTLYTFAFGGYNSQNELVDGLTKSFIVATCHTFCTELIWSYIAAASYKLRDLVSFDVSLTYLLQRYTSINEVSEENEFASHMNPFNRFLLKHEIISEPAPLIRSFTSVLLMAARLFSTKPLHATSFQHIALTLAEILNNQDLVLTACRETLATIQPLISKTYFTPWVIQPLLHIVDALKFNKKTQNTDEHQKILAKAAYALDSSFITLFQERQISLYIMNSVMELPANKWKTAFILFATKNGLVESSLGNDQTLPIYAAELFRMAPDKSFDEVFTKFRLDPLFNQAIVYLISAAHNVGMFTQGINWSKQFNEYIKSILHEPEEQKAPKKTTKNQKFAAKKKQTTLKGKQKEQAKNNQEDILMAQSAHKIHQVWVKYQARRKNINKFYENNKIRCVVSLLNALCILETGNLLAHSNPAISDIQKKDPKHGKQVKAPKHAQKKPVEEKKELGIDHANQFVQTIINAIVFAERCGKTEIMHCASLILRVFLSTVKPKTPLFDSISQKITSIAYVLTDYLPLQEQWAKDVLSDVLLIVLHNNKASILIDVLQKAVKVDIKCGMMLWMAHGNELPNELKEVLSIIQKRDPAENSFYTASDILNRCNPENSVCFYGEGLSAEAIAYIKAAEDIAISLQHKQRLSMSISLLRRIGFIYHQHNNDEKALKIWQEALECHFRVVRAHEKVDQLLADQTEEKFYQKHSWAGCISIFVLCSYIAMLSEKEQAMQMCRLGAFAIGSLFSNTYTNPKKQIDYATYEPSEIVPGVDIFSEYDPAQPLLEPVKASVLSKAIIYLLCAMETYEIYFEMFKPLSFARHFFRFIVREKNVLARVRLQTVLNCAHFGLITSAVDVINDVVSNFGLPRTTKETTVMSQSFTKYPFNQSDPITTHTNSEALKFITSQQTFTTITNNFGAQISCQYALCVCRLLSVISEAQNPVGENVDVVPTYKPPTSSGKKSHRRSHTPHIKKDDLTASTSSLLSSEAGDILKNAEAIITEFIGKEYRQDQLALRFELQLELAYIKMHQWMWENAMQICYDVKKGINEACIEGAPFGDNHLDKPFRLASGFIDVANKMISQCSYNIHDIKGASKHASPYYQALIFIHRAEYENAGKLLTKVVLSKPITAFYKEYILCCAQLVTLFCENHKLYDECVADLPVKQKKLISPLSLSITVYENTSDFFTQQLGMKDSRNIYLRYALLLIRLQYLVAKTNASFNGENDTSGILNNAIENMHMYSPYLSHGLNFLISVTAARIKMKNFLAKNPNVIQFWNRDSNPIKTSVIPQYNSQEVEEMVESLSLLFVNNPDCAVHPISNKAIIDLAVLTGILPDDGNRLNKTYNALVLASAIRTSKRFIQSLVAKCKNSPPQTCPVLLQNDNKDKNMWQLAAAYYTHVCSLDMPIFDTELLETRTLLFFKCFEEQCALFKSLSAQPESIQEHNYITGQWYQVSTKGIKKERPEGTTTLKSPRSARSIQSNTFTYGSRATTAATGQRKNSFIPSTCYFFLGIITSDAEAGEKKSHLKLTPIVLAGNLTEIQNVYNEMSELGISVQEVVHMEKVCGQEEQAKEISETRTSKKRVSLKAQKSNMALIPTTVTAPLRNQTKAAEKNASIKWSVASHKLEALLMKSSKIVSSLYNDQSRWGNEIKVTGIEKESAITISHIFNTQLGVHDKDENVCKWLLSSQDSSVPEATPLPQLK